MKHSKAYAPGSEPALFLGRGYTGSGRDSARGHQNDDDHAQGHPVQEEVGELVGGDELQQPGDRRVGDHAGDHGRDDRGGPPDLRGADVLRRRDRLEQARGDERGDAHEEGQARGRDPVKTQEQSRRDGRPGTGDAKQDRGEDLEEANDEGISAQSRFLQTNGRWSQQERKKPDLTR